MNIDFFLYLDELTIAWLAQLSETLITVLPSISFVIIEYIIITLNVNVNSCVRIFMISNISCNITNHQVPLQAVTS
mgnify:CR=1 FL=1